MANLNLRNIDLELLAKLKVGAAKYGTTLREHCFLLLRSDGITYHGPEASRELANLPANKFAAPVEHHITCTCYRCKPPKEV